MTQSKKPLHPYEQSMLLSAMLFDQKNLQDILKFFPDEQALRMSIAKEKFIALPRNERMTQIVLELRRLLLLDENRIDWIHKSWIEDALAKEPPYLRKIIEQSIDERLRKRSARSPTFEKSNILLTLIFRMFVGKLTKTPQKTAIYDPVLMRLQSLKDEAQNESFTTIGLISIKALSLVIDQKKLFSYLTRKGLIVLPPDNVVLSESNPYNDNKLRRHFLQELIRVKDNNCTIHAGLITTALYLSCHKYQWQRTIILGLHKKFGSLIEELILRAKDLTLNQNSHKFLSHLLLRAF